MKAERDFGPSFLWVRAGIPSPEQDVCFEYLHHSLERHGIQRLTARKLWLEAPGAKGQPHVDRTVHLPPPNRATDGTSRNTATDGTSLNS